MEASAESSIGFNNKLDGSLHLVPRQLQAPLSVSANDWKVQFDVIDEDVSVK